MILGYLLSWQFSLLIAFELLTIPSPTTLLPFCHARFHTLPSSFIVVAAAPTVRRRRTDLERSSSGRLRAVMGSPVPRRLPDRLGRIEFTDRLRTGHSSQVALHLVSRQRSYHFRLRAGNAGPEGSFTRQFKRLHRRTKGACFQAPITLYTSPRRSANSPSSL